MPARTQRSWQVDVAAHARRSSAAFGRSGDVAGKTAGKVRRSRALAFAGRGVDRSVAGRQACACASWSKWAAIPIRVFSAVSMRPTRRAADEAIEAVGMTAKADSYVAELSDGERQKAMIAKTLAQQCPVILLDEPTAFLDVASRIEIMELLHRLARLQRKTVLLSTHDVEQALRLSDRIWLLSRAEGFCCGTPEDLALSGRMDLYFGRGGLFFDRQAGGLRSRQDDAPAVRFEAADEALARWTKNALERNGFRPISDGRDESLPLVRVSAPDRIEWYRPGFPSLTCRSFEEWVGGGLCDAAERSGAE